MQSITCCTLNINIMAGSFRRQRYPHRWPPERRALHLNLHSLDCRWRRQGPLRLSSGTELEWWVFRSLFSLSSHVAHFFFWYEFVCVCVCVCVWACICAYQLYTYIHIAWYINNTYSMIHKYILSSGTELEWWVLRSLLVALSQVMWSMFCFCFVRVCVCIWACICTYQLYVCIYTACISICVNRIHTHIQCTYTHKKHTIIYIPINVGIVDMSMRMYLCLHIMKW